MGEGVRDTVIAIITATLGAYIMYDIGRSRGYAKGYSEGYDLARGWRDEAIEKWHALAKAALQQRDEARATRIVLAPAPPTEASKEWN
jgi:flagellar biosynthesis/type III secretory pathway protein FliH